MATKKTTAKSATKKTSDKKSTQKTAVKATSKSATVVKKVSSSETTQIKLDLPRNLVNIVIAETIGTFILTLAVLTTAAVLSSLYAGIALGVIVLMISAVSGAHVNPAVTFGLWTMRKLKTILVPFYWAAQFLGAMAAVVLLGAISNNSLALNFDNFTQFSWIIFLVELVGMAVFMFGISAATTRKISPAAAAAGVGASLAVAILVASSLMPFAQSAIYEKYQEEQAAKLSTRQEAATDENERPYPRELYIEGATLNPAVALAVIEKTDVQSSNPVPAKDAKAYSRLGLETIFGTLVGAAIGGNLFLLVNYRNKNED